MKKYFLSLLLVTLATADINAERTQTTKGITVKVNNGTTAVRGFETAPKLVRLEVIDANIIHVSATAEENFADRPSLIVTPQKAYTDYKVKEDKGMVTITTPAINAHVLKATGGVLSLIHI